MTNREKYETIRKTTRKARVPIYIRINNFNFFNLMAEDIVQWKVNQDLLDRVLDIKKEEQRKIKKGFSTWIKYIRTWKS